jgi:hypothetical protein
MSLPARTLEEHLQDAGKALVQLQTKQAELLAAIQKRAPGDEIGELHAELDALTELWATVIDELVSSVRK